MSENTNKDELFEKYGFTDQKSKSAAPDFGGFMSGATVSYDADPAEEPVTEAVSEPEAELTDPGLNYMANMQNMFKSLAQDDTEEPVEEEPVEEEAAEEATTEFSSFMLGKEGDIPVKSQSDLLSAEADPFRDAPSVEVPSEEPEAEEKGPATQPGPVESDEQVSSTRRSRKKERKPVEKGEEYWSFVDSLLDNFDDSKPTSRPRTGYNTYVEEPKVTAEEAAKAVAEATAPIVGATAEPAKRRRRRKETITAYEQDLLDEYSLGSGGHARREEQKAEVSAPSAPKAPSAPVGDAPTQPAPTTAASTASAAEARSTGEAPPAGGYFLPRKNAVPEAARPKAQPATPVAEPVAPVAEPVEPKVVIEEVVEETVLEETPFVAPAPEVAPEELPLGAPMADYEPPMSRKERKALKKAEKKAAKEQKAAAKLAAQEAKLAEKEAKAEAKLATKEAKEAEKLAAAEAAVVAAEAAVAAEEEAVFTGTEVVADGVATEERLAEEAVAEAAVEEVVAEKPVVESFWKPKTTATEDTPAETPADEPVAAPVVETPAAEKAASPKLTLNANAANTEPVLLADDVVMETVVLEEEPAPVEKPAPAKEPAKKAKKARKAKKDKQERIANKAEASADRELTEEEQNAAFDATYVQEKKSGGALKVIRNIIITLAALVILACAVILGYSYAQQKVSDRQFAQAATLLEEGESVKNLRAAQKKYPDVNFPATMQARFAELYAQNTDLTGWVAIPGTNINYPVVQTDNDTFYINHNFKKAYSEYGTPFLSCKNDSVELDLNNVVYGQTPKSGGKMFSELSVYRTSDGFLKNPIIEYSTLYENYKFKVYGVFLTNSSAEQDNGYVFDYTVPNLGTVESFAGFVEQINQRRLYDTGVDIESTDKLLTLSTNADDFDGARLVVVARLLRDGESESVSKKLVKNNKNPRYPQAYYDANGTENPYATELGWVPTVS